MEYKDAKVGMKVRMNNSECHSDYPEFYPKKGTIGVVVKANQYDCIVKWPDGSVGFPYSWYCNYVSLDTVDDNITKMTDDEIWNMLKGKLEKNGIDVDYQPECFKKAVALAYTVGYKRAKKGRLFKYDSKTSNRFVVDKNGNKIYYNDDEVKIGVKVVFTLKGKEPCEVWPEYGTTGKVVKYGSPEGKGLWVVWEGGNEEHHNWREYCKKVID